MNCTDVTAILDEHAASQLSAADRCALDEHVAGCEPCGFAWQAQGALLSTRVPATSAQLLDRVLCAVGSWTEQPPRRARLRVVLVGALLAAGAALATVTAMRMAERGGGESATSDARNVRESAQGPTAASQSSAPDATAAAGSNAIPVALDDVDIEYSYALRTPPVYPPEALERKLEGDVTLEFTIDEHGAVKNAHAVRSSDPLFEPSAVAAISQWRYLARVRAGKPVAVGGVQTVLRFQLEMPPPPPTAAKRADSTRGSEAKSTPPVSPAGAQAAGSESPAQRSANPVDFATFDDWIAKIWQRLAADDLRGAELALDELRATYDLDDSQNNRAWTFYGYIYTRYADYGRAIDAYEKAVATKVGYGSDLSTSLADLYFARHQYDKALKTLLTHKQQVPSGRISPEATAMIEKLRALGVTEETL